MPLDDESDIISVLLRITFSPLRGSEGFKLLIPLCDISSDQSLGAELSDAQVNRRALMVRSSSVRQQFLVVDRDQRAPIGIIIYLPSQNLGAYYRILLTNVFEAFPQ